LLPRLYETEHIPLEEKIIHMHFFLAGCDWYIAEYDGGDLFWGYVILNNDHQSAEWGYISFSELKDIKIKGGLEIDSRSLLAAAEGVGNPEDQERVVSV